MGKANNIQVSFECDGSTDEAAGWSRLYRESWLNATSTGFDKAPESDNVTLSSYLALEHVVVRARVVILSMGVLPLFKSLPACDATFADVAKNTHIQTMFQLLLGQTHSF